MYILIITTKIAENVMDPSFVVFQKNRHEIYLPDLVSLAGEAEISLFFRNDFAIFKRILVHTANKPILLP
jgi:hypothetical protein